MKNKKKTQNCGHNIKDLGFLLKTKNKAVAVCRRSFKKLENHFVSR